MIPAFALVSVVGAGFATWYWSDDQKQSVDANVDITDEVSTGFSVAVSDSKTGTLILDQETATNHPKSDPARGVFLTTTDWETENFAGDDGLDLTVTHSGGDVTGTATLHCIASWTGDGAANAGKYLTLTTTEITTPLSGWADEDSDTNYTTEITVGANSGDINLGIAYGGEVGQPENTTEYNTMVDELMGKLTLNLTFYVTVA